MIDGLNKFGFNEFNNQREHKKLKRTWRRCSNLMEARVCNDTITGVTEH